MEDPEEKQENFVVAFNNRGSAYNDKGEYDRAIQDFDEAVRLDPNNAQPLNNREAVLRDLGQNARAAADFAKVRLLNPSLPPPPK